MRRIRLQVQHHALRASRGSVWNARIPDGGCAMIVHLVLEVLHDNWVSRSRSTSESDGGLTPSGVRAP